MCGDTVKAAVLAGILRRTPSTADVATRLIVFSGVEVTVARCLASNGGCGGGGGGRGGGGGGGRGWDRWGGRPGRRNTFAAG